MLASTQRKMTQLAAARNLHTQLPASVYPIETSCVTEWIQLDELIEAPKTFSSFSLYPMSGAHLRNQHDPHWSTRHGTCTYLREVWKDY